MDQYEGIDRLQRDVLEAIAVRKPLAAVMDLLCRRVEELVPELVCTVLLVDKAGRLHTCAAPNMSSVYCAALEGAQIGPRAGSCGTAAWRGADVEVSDIATDPLWEDYPELVRLVRLAGLAACWSSPIKGADGRVVGTFAIYYREPRGASPYHRHIVQACVHLCTIAIQDDEARSLIHRLIFYDELTGLPNRTLLSERATVALTSAAVKSEQIAAMLIDIDHFKTINDSLGRSVGDRYLQEVARRLRGAVADTDTLCRLGGDEFAALVQVTDGVQAADLAERLRTTVQQPVEIDGVALACSASIGISLFPYDSSDFEGLLHNAEVGMYHAKAAGRNCLRFFTSEMDDAARYRFELDSAIRYAIERNEFVLEYQPQIRLEDGAFYGVEALVRWNHPQRGRVQPAQFIPRAQERGFIDDIDVWVLDEACRQLAAWDRAGVVVPLMAVNVAATAFEHDKIAVRVSEALKRHGLPGERLIVEITESLMMYSNAGTHRAFEALGEMGVRVSLDDFGTGYSSLSYLKRLPASQVKLDRSFVTDLENDPGDQALSVAVMHIGKSLGLTVVAEGVETAAQLAFLRMHGCDIAQGFFFSRALPPEELERFLVRRSAP